MKQRPTMTRTVCYGSIASFLTYCGISLIFPGLRNADLVLSPLSVLLGGVIAGRACDYWLQTREQRLRHCFRLIAQTGRVVRKEAVLDFALRGMATIAEATSGCLYLCDPPGEELRLSATTCWNEALDFRERFSLVSPQDLLPASLLPLAGPTLISEPELSRPVRHLSRVSTVRSALFLPLYAGSSLLGLFVLTFITPPCMSPEEQLALRALSEQLTIVLRHAEEYEALQKEANTDPLTAIYSRRYFDSIYRQALARASRTQSPLCVAMIDIDNLKQINDCWGHPTGDTILREVGSLLRSSFRDSDVVARYGGDEFVVLLPDTTREQAEQPLQRVRENLVFLNATGRHPIAISLSMGVRQFTEEETDPLAAADAAMYRNKRQRP